MTPKGQLRIGQIGAGPWAHLHMQALVDNRFVGDVYLAEEDEQARADLAKPWGIIKRAVVDYRELLADDSVDAIDLAVPPALAPKIAEEALRAGKPVILDAPPATSLADFDRMTQAAEAAGMPLFLLLPELSHPALSKARELVEEGEVGPPFLGRCLITAAEARGPEEDDETESESFFAGLYQAAYVLEYLLGPARTAQAEITAVVTCGVLTYDNSVLGEMAIAGASGGSGQTQEVHLLGLEGMLLVRAAPEDELPLLLMHGQEIMPIHVPLPLAVKPWLAARVLEEVVDCLRQGTPPEGRVAEARSALATALAMAEAARSGQKAVVR